MPDEEEIIPDPVQDEPEDEGPSSEDIEADLQARGAALEFMLQNALQTRISTLGETVQRIPNDEDNADRRAQAIQEFQNERMRAAVAQAQIPQAIQQARDLLIQVNQETGAPIEYLQTARDQQEMTRLGQIWKNSHPSRRAKPEPAQPKAAPAAARQAYQSVDSGISTSGSADPSWKNLSARQKIRIGLGLQKMPE